MKETKRRVKIVFAGLYDDDNLGDPVIAKCTEDLYKSFIPEDSYEIAHVSINHFCFHEPSYFVMKAFGLNTRFHLNLPRLNEWLIRRDYIHHFDKNLKDANVVIVVGGGLLEFTGGRFADGLYAIAYAGCKHNFPVIINATGIEGYDSTNRICRKLKKMLHLKSVRYVSTRDDISTLVDSYIDGNPEVECEKVADSAVWSSEVFDIKKHEQATEIGLGVVRKNIFEQYGSNFSEKQVIDLYCDLYKNLKAKGHKVVFFTNGTSADYMTAREVVDRLSCEGYDPIIRIPVTAKELVETLSNFKGVIAGRLHSCIISYSLNIPAVGLVWNDKMRLFGNEIGHPENFITVGAFDSQHISDVMESAIENGYNLDRRSKYRETSINAIQRCVDNIIKPLMK